MTATSTRTGSVRALLAAVLALALFGWGVVAAAPDEALATVVWIETEDETEEDAAEEDADSEEDADADAEEDATSEDADDSSSASLGESLADLATTEIVSTTSDETTSEETTEEAEEEVEEEDPLATEPLDADDNEVNPSQLSDSSFIYDTSIEDLSTADTYYDGQTVQVVGEVVGDLLYANASGTYCWISLSSEDSDAVIAVYMNTVAASGIDTYGSYGSTGTILQVRGTFNLSCEDHDGETDLHAEVVSVVSRGSTDADEFDIADFLPGVCAVCLGLLLMFVFYVLRERLR